MFKPIEIYENLFQFKYLTHWHIQDTEWQQ